MRADYQNQPGPPPSLASVSIVMPRIVELVVKTCSAVAMIKPAIFGLLLTLELLG